MNGNPLVDMMANNPMINAIQNSPWVQIINMVKSNNNPMAVLSQLGANNPGMNQAMQMANGKSPEEFGAMMQNEAQKKGINIAQVAKAIGMPPEVAKQYGIDV